MEKTPLTPIEQAAMKALVDHLEPCDCRWETYADAARAVASAVERAQETESILSDPDAMAAIAEVEHETLYPTPEENFWDDRTTSHLDG